MSFWFPNSFRKAAEADIDHSRYGPNLWIFWYYTLYDFWTVAAGGLIVYLLALWAFGASMYGGMFTTISALLYAANFTAIATIFWRAQKAFSGKTEKEISDIPFALGAILMLLATFHTGFLAINVVLAAVL